MVRKTENVTHMYKINKPVTSKFGFHSLFSLYVLLHNVHYLCSPFLYRLSVMTFCTTRCGFMPTTDVVYDSDNSEPEDALMTRMVERHNTAEAFRKRR